VTVVGRELERRNMKKKTALYSLIERELCTHKYSEKGKIKNVNTLSDKDRERERESDRAEEEEEESVRMSGERKKREKKLRSAHLSLQ
jgi:hypothetical protein